MTPSAKDSEVRRLQIKRCGLRYKLVIWPSHTTLVARIVTESVDFDSAGLLGFDVFVTQTSRAGSCHNARVKSPTPRALQGPSS